jgi:hypothetical protein
MGSGASGAGNAARPQTSASPTKEDEQYVRQICVAATGFVKAIEKIGDSASSNGSKEITSEEDFAKAFGDLFDAMMGPMADFLDGFAKATPPKDLKDWHAQAAKVMHDAATSLRKGDFAALEKLDSSKLADPPAEAMARLEKAVANVKECNELEQLGQDGSLFGN